MYCINCGKKNEGNLFCTDCGTKLNNIDNKEVVNKNESGLKIASIILGSLGIVVSLTFLFSSVSFIVSLIGLILGIVATKKEKNAIGIVLNSVGLFLSIIMIILWGLLFRLIFSLPDSYEDEYYHEEYYEYYDNKDIFDTY